MSKPDDQSTCGASRGGAYDYLVSVYEDDALEPALRLQAARAALPYERPPLRGAAVAAAAQETEAQRARRAELLASIENCTADLRRREEALAEAERRVSRRPTQGERSRKPDRADNP